MNTLLSKALLMGAFAVFGRIKLRRGRLGKATILGTERLGHYHKGEDDFSPARFSSRGG